MKKKNNLFYIYSFKSDFVINNILGKDFVYNTTQARQDLNLVSLADNAIFQFLRKIKKQPFNREELDKLYKIRNDEKSLPKMKQDVKKIERYQKKIDDMLFVPEVVIIGFSNKAHYKQVVKEGLFINGEEYTRFVCTAAYLRRNKVLFINKKYYSQMNEILMCGLDNKLKETNLGKYSAYYGLFASATNQITTPNVCVIGDYETDLSNQEVSWITTDEDDKENIERKTMDLSMNWFDGMGLVSPNMAKQWAEDLTLDYLPAGFIIRSAYIKGLCAPFDFHRFFREVAKKDIIRDVWGKEYNVNDIDVILTVSQFKMWKQYDNWQDYLYYFNKYGHTWGCSRVNKKEDDEYVLTNYQYLQTLNLSHEDINELAAPTVDWINSIGSGDLMNVLLYLLGSRNDENEDAEDIFKEVQMDFVKGIMVNPDLLKDEYVKSQILKTLKRKIKDAKIGRLWVRGNYSFQISDPYALCEWAAEMPVKGLVGENEIYCHFWNLRTNSDVLLTMRSPLVDTSEHCLRKRVTSPEMEDWYSYLWSGYVNSVWDKTVVNLSDSDYDRRHLSCYRQSYNDKCSISR